MKQIKTIAMYLPQFHQIPENDRWWGNGFTEWSAVKKAEPLYEGHVQPRKPLNGRYYNLLDKATMEWQAELANRYGITGFCFYHYWFEKGRRILEKPAENLLKWKDINISFCFSWANESWIRTWENIVEGNAWAEKFDIDQNIEENQDGILLKQEYGTESDWKEHFDYLLPFFKDERYIKIDGKPIFIIYKPEHFKNCLEPMLQCWKRWAEEAGLPGLYIIGAQCSVISKTVWPSVDARVKHGPAVCLANEEKKGEIRFFDYDYLWKRFLGLEGNNGDKTYYCGFVDFDSSPRQGQHAIIFRGASPDKFKKYFDQLVRKSIQLENEFIFLNAWNEWGEGMYLEPDENNGYKYLEAVRSVMEKYRQIEVSGETLNTRAVDIIVPVYNAYEELKKCIQSIKKYTNLNIHRVLLLNDSSTDERILPFLETQQEDNIIIFNNEKNLGFSANINQGIRFSNRDVILLNSDTIVTDRWIEKLIQCAYSGNMIATATPLSNNATIFSVPEYCKENKLPAEYTIDRYAELVEKSSMKRYATVPTAHGYCMYIKREVIDRIGDLDEVGFERGYGEENDFCYRARQLGYRDVMCDDTFIYHSGTSSFLSDEKLEYIQKHVELIRKRHPTQFEITDAYCRNDSNWDIHDNVKLQTYLNAADRMNIFYLLQSDFKENAADNVGGVQLHIKDLVERLKFKDNIIVAARDAEFLNVTLYANDDIFAYQVYIGKTTEFPEIRNDSFYELYYMLLKFFRVQCVHVHHTLGLSLEIFYVSHILEIPLYLTLHDYYYLCPNIKMLDYSDQLCLNGETRERCGQCLSKLFHIAETTDYLSIWREENNRALSLCKKIIVPSNFTKAVIKQYFPGLEKKIITIEHGSDSSVHYRNEKKGKEFRVAFIGGLNVAKGAKYAYDMIVNGPSDIEWYIFGNLGYLPLEKLQQKNLNKTGQYKRDDLPILLEEAQIDIICILPIWPETFCYTLSEALLTGIPVLATDCGAVGERMKKLGCGWVVPANSSYKEILSTLITIRKNRPEYLEIRNKTQHLNLKSVEEMCLEYRVLYKEDMIGKPSIDSKCICTFYDMQKKMRNEKKLKNLQPIIEEKDALIQNQIDIINNQAQTVEAIQNELERMKNVSMEANDELNSLKNKAQKFEQYFNLLKRWMEIREQGQCLERYFINNNYYRIAIYGWGNLGKLLYSDLRNTEVAVDYVIDKSAGKGTDDIKILGPDGKLPLTDAIIITPIMAFEEIKGDLQNSMKIPVVSLEEVVFSMEGA